MIFSMSRWLFNRPNRRLAVVVLLVLSARIDISHYSEPTLPCQNATGQIVLTSITSAIYSHPVLVNVYLPPCYDANGSSTYPALYLLHGGGADQTQWPDLNLQVAANELISQTHFPFVIVMPGAEYSNAVDYTGFILHDLLPAVEAQFHLQSFRAGRGIGGLSLGGYIALQVSFLHPDLFAMVGGYSPVVNRGTPDDPLLLIRQLTPLMQSQLQSLRIDLDVGGADSLVYDTQLLADALRRQGLVVTLTIEPGGSHQRSYWRTRTYDYLSFFLEAIRSCPNCF